MEENKLKLNPLWSDNRLWEPNKPIDMTTGFSNAFAKEPQIIDPYFSDDELNHVGSHFSDALAYTIKEHFERASVETIDIDHEVIEPKQLPSHEKEQD